MSKIMLAELLSDKYGKIAISFDDEVLMVGKSLGIEPELDDDGDETDDDVLVFLPEGYIDIAYRLKEEQIKEVIGVVN